MKWWRSTHVEVFVSRKYYDRGNCPKWGNVYNVGRHIYLHGMWELESPQEPVKVAPPPSSFTHLLYTTDTIMPFCHDRESTHPHQQ